MGGDLRSYIDQKFSALARMVELERELTDKNRELDLLRAKGRSRQGLDDHIEENQTLGSSRSEITVYRNAVDKSKRGSSSSEEVIDTSNEMDIPEEDDGDFEQLRQRDSPMQEDFVNDHDLHNFVSEREMEMAKDLEKDRRRSRDRDVRDRRPERRERNRESSDHNRYQYGPTPKQDFVGEKAKCLVNDAEAAKARIYEVPGKYDSDSDDDHQLQVIRDFRKNIPTVQMDEDYRLVASHIDHKMRIQIINHEYIDFAKLLPRNRVGQVSEDQILQMVNRGGVPGFVQVADRTQSIHNYARWEQAFRVFSDVYTERYPARATELIQYNHVIHMAAQSYVWDNVYSYDIEFRKHMNLHPSRNWGIILTMAWTMCIKDRHSQQFRGQGLNDKKHSKPPPSEMKTRKACIDFNKGNCTYGPKCKFDHRCGMCNKYGHGSHACKRFVAAGSSDASSKVKNEQ